MIPLANHLWQSTVCAAVAALLAHGLRNHRAQLRYWIWLAASVKFLIPFSVLVSAGSRIELRGARALAPSPSAAVEQIGQPFGMTAMPATVPVTDWASPVIGAVWIAAVAKMEVRIQRIRERMRNLLAERFQPSFGVTRKNCPCMR